MDNSQKIDELLDMIQDNVNTNNIIKFIEKYNVDLNALSKDNEDVISHAIACDNNDALKAICKNYFHEIKDEYIEKGISKAKEKENTEAFKILLNTSGKNNLKKDYELTLKNGF
jgi:uncharacterized protein YbgA (DUF1722 family)